MFQSQKRLPKWCQHFVKNDHFFVEKLKILFSSDHTILFKFNQHVVQILSNNVWRDFLTSNVTISNGNIKCPIGKSSFSRKFAVKTLPRYRCQCWNCKFKNFPYIPLKMFVPYASKIWTKSYGLNYTKFWAFWPKKKKKKKDYFKTILDKTLTSFLKTFL